MLAHFTFYLNEYDNILIFFHMFNMFIIVFIMLIKKFFKFFILKILIIFKNFFIIYQTIMSLKI